MILESKKKITKANTTTIIIIIITIIMGSSVSIPKVAFQILRVAKNSPAWLAGLDPYFDYIVEVNGHPVEQDTPHLVSQVAKANINEAVNLVIFNSRLETYREVFIIPKTDWGGEGLIGCSIRFCSYEEASSSVWHVLNIISDSPADKAGLIDHRDYIIGTTQGFLYNNQDLVQLLEDNDLKPVQMIVYNVDLEAFREVIVIPDKSWGGNGSLGCDIGFGYLHRIPKAEKQKLLSEIQTAPLTPFIHEALHTHKTFQQNLLDQEKPSPHEIQAIEDTKINTSAHLLSNSALSDRLDKENHVSHRKQSSPYTSSILMTLSNELINHENSYNNSFDNIHLLFPQSSLTIESPQSEESVSEVTKSEPKTRRIVSPNLVTISSQLSGSPPPNEVMNPSKDLISSEFLPEETHQEPIIFSHMSHHDRQQMEENMKASQLQPNSHPEINFPSHEKLVSDLSTSTITTRRNSSVQQPEVTETTDKPTEEFDVLDIT